MRTYLVQAIICIALLSSGASGVRGAAKPVDPRAPRNSDGKVFVHPGISYTQGDLDRMKAMVDAGVQPWKRCFDALAGSRWAGHGVKAPWRGEDLRGFNNTIGFDGRFAHDQALMWRLTGDEGYAQRARDLINASVLYKDPWKTGTPALDNGKIFLLVEAAELIRDYPGWAEADKAKFRKVLNDVFYQAIKNGDSARWGNQGLSGFKGLLAMAIFLDDTKKYDRVWNYLMGLRHRPDDEPYPTGPLKLPWWPSETWGHNTEWGEYCHSRKGRFSRGNEEDWGFDELLKYYIYKNGQCEETCRDMAHTNYGLFNYVGIAEMFWNQGDDLYGALDNRILLGLEWNLRYNLSDWMPTGYTDKEDEATFENGLFYKAYTRSARWTALKPSPHGRGAQGGPGAPRTAALMHYSIVKGVPDEKCKWLRKSVEDTLANNGCETWGFGPNWYYEYCGWGTLTKTRTKWMRGDPVTWVKGRRVSGAHKLPGVIRITDWDYYPLEDRPRTHRHKQKGRWSDGDWALYTVTCPEAKEMKVSLAFTSLGRAEVVIASDYGKPLARELVQAKEKRVATLGRISVPAGASVIRFAVRESAPGFKPLGLKFE